jgi:hypothetical protein
MPTKGVSHGEICVLLHLLKRRMGTDDPSPGDRTAAVRQLAGAMGGSIEAIYWMTGRTTGSSSPICPIPSAPPR